MKMKKENQRWKIAKQLSSHDQKCSESIMKIQENLIVSIFDVLSSFENFLITSTAFFSSNLALIAQTMMELLINFCF